MSLSSEPRLHRSIGISQGVALYVGAVIGPGLLVLPSVAAETAGPASLVAWGALIALSLPMALSFAALARAYPQVGGFSTYVERAFGRDWGAVTGWLFFFCIPSGSLIVALIAGQYAAGAFGLGRDGMYISGALLMLAVYAVNAIGMQMSARLQVWVTIGIMALISIAIVSALPRIESAAFSPFMPNGPTAIGLAAVQLFWSFAGWEAITPLAEEFHNPKRDMWRATLIAVVVVGVIYSLLAVATVGTRAYGASLQGAAPLGAMAARAFGVGAHLAAGVVALFVSFGSANAYIAGTSRLGYALGKAHQLPRWFAALDSRTGAPRHALGFLCAGFLLWLAASYFLNLGVADLLPISTSSYVATYLLSMAAAVRLLSGRGRLAAWIGFIACLIVFLFVGAFFAWIIGVTVAALLYLRVRGRVPQAEPNP